MDVIHEQYAAVHEMPPNQYGEHFALETITPTLTLRAQHVSIAPSPDLPRECSWRCMTFRAQVRCALIGESV